MSRREYKTVALPQLVQGRRKRRQTVAGLVAEAHSGLLNAQAEQGWRHVSSTTATAYERRGWLSKRELTTFTVYVFEREASEAQDLAEATQTHSAEPPFVGRPPRPAALEEPRDQVERDLVPTPASVTTRDD